METPTPPQPEEQKELGDKLIDALEQIKNPKTDLRASRNAVEQLKKERDLDEKLGLTD